MICPPKLDKQTLGGIFMETTGIKNRKHTLEEKCKRMSISETMVVRRLRIYRILGHLRFIATFTANSISACFEGEISS
ncbi:hypothetical protein EZS27_022222 [termite gut metagenome]|uniref:Uncharacterized protein n=1 Tax=termite gut metagenome TaxID=433724 RepID=A0A5J4R5F6_9ZZZZ